MELASKRCTTVHSVRKMVGARPLTCPSNTRRWCFLLVPGSYRCRLRAYKVSRDERDERDHGFFCGATAGVIARRSFLSLSACELYMYSRAYTERCTKYSESSMPAMRAPGGRARRRTRNNACCLAAVCPVCGWLKGHCYRLQAYHEFSSGMVGWGRASLSDGSHYPRLGARLIGHRDV